MLLRIEACPQSLQTEGLTQRGLYTEQFLHADACFYAHKFLHISFTQTSLYTEKPLHRASFLYTEAFTRTKALQAHRKALRTRLYTQSFYTQTLLRIEACSQSRVYTEQLLHRERPLHRAAYTILYTQKL